MPSIVILGAGPMGLAAAFRLSQIGYPDWVLCEASAGVGGLSASAVDEAGFTWDLGGHVIFTKHEFFRDLIAVALDGQVREIERSARIWTHGRWIPYPFQNNVHRLPPQLAEECIQGAMRAQKLQAQNPARPENFAQWTEASFGEPIARELARPFNEKVWCVPLEELAYDWIGERVSPIDAERLMANALHDRDDTDWGPNNRFVFPRHGGTGAIWDGLADYIGRERIHLNRRATAIDPTARTVSFADGSQLEYDWLLSSVPLDELVPMVRGAGEQVLAASAELFSNSVELVGVGLEKPLHDHTTCWMYCAEHGIPIYRITNFAHYAAANVPGADTARFSALMCETPHSPRMPLPPGDLADHVMDGLARCELIGEADRTRIASIWRASLPKAYPVPMLSRDAALAVIQPFLEERRILSRGRFGTWRYEIGNMDHAAQMGKEAVDRIVLGEDEVVAAAGT